MFVLYRMEYADKKDMTEITIPVDSDLYLKLDEIASLIDVAIEDIAKVILYTNLLQNESYTLTKKTKALVIINTKDLELTCSAAPYQLEGKDVKGRDIYIRSRHGSLTIDIDGEEYYQTWSDVFSLDELRRATRGYVTFVGNETDIKGYSKPQPISNDLFAEILESRKKSKPVIKLEEEEILKQSEIEVGGNE